MAEEETFKVTDRRGRLRESSQPEAPPSTHAPEPQPEVSESAQETPPSPRVEPGGPDLQGLFVMFASSALIGLGGAADPMTGEQRVDIDQAQEAIDTLLLLRDKTEGNRTEAESRLLEDILYDLQIQFVRVTKSGRLPGLR